MKYFLKCSCFLFVIISGCSEKIKDKGINIRELKFSLGNPTSSGTKETSLFSFAFAVDNFDSSNIVHKQMLCSFINGIVDEYKIFTSNPTVNVVLYYETPYLEDANMNNSTYSGLGLYSDKLKYILSCSYYDKSLKLQWYPNSSVLYEDTTFYKITPYFEIDSNKVEKRKW